MTEAIDTACHLRRGESPINHERLAKGGMICRNGVYQQEYPHVIDWMLDQGILDTFQHSAAADIITLREVALSVVGLARLTATSDWLGGRSNAPSCPMTIYSRVSRQLKPWQWARVMRICFEPVYDRDLAWIRFYTSSTQESFDALENAIDNVRKEGLEYATEEGITAPEVQQPA